MLLCGTLVGADWPQFRGPQRDGISRETGLLQRWPEGGPPLLWRAHGIGRGYSSAALLADTLVITGDSGEDLVVTALEPLTGATRWHTTHGRSWRGPYPGARATCTLTEGKLFLLNAHGRLLCADLADGRELWSVDILERFQGHNIQWGLSECLLLEAGRVIVTAGGDLAFLAALDGATGETVWTGPPLAFTRTVAFGGKPVDPPVAAVDRAGYASPIAFEVAGKRLLAAVGARHLVVADAANGALLWTRELPVVYDVIGAIPAWSGSGLVFSAPDVGTLCFGVTLEGAKVTVSERWRHPSDSCHGGLLPLGDALYGSGYRLFRPWVCLDAASGALRYERRDLAEGCLLYADGCLYALSQKGEMALLQPTPTGFVDLGRFRLPGDPAADVWSHPAIANGRLFIRRHDDLFCYDLRASPPP